MGNCQTADVAAVMIQHPDGRLERAYWSLTASDVMAANPGHYVAVLSIVVIAPRRSDAPGASSGEGRGGGARSHDHRSVRYLTLLRPDDPLLVGNFYRLISFEDVLREFGSKRRVRLSKLLTKEEERRRRSKAEEEEDDDRGNDTSSSEVISEEEEKEVQRLTCDGEIDSGDRIRMPKHVAWRPTLQTIYEVGSA